MRAIRQKYVEVAACHFARNDVQLVLDRHLSDQVAHTNRQWP